MSKKPPAEPTIRKTIGLPASMWAEIDAVARTIPGKLPSEPATVRLLVRRALDLFARPRWQPIETAPMFQTVLVWTGTGYRLGQRWTDEGDGFFLGDEDGQDVPATHWRPLPEPPGAD